MTDEAIDTQRQQQLIIAIDVVGSVEATELYGERQGNLMIGAVLDLARAAIRVGDPTLHISGSPLGDSSLMIGGSDFVGAYKAACLFQGGFKAWSYSQLPIKIAMGYGTFETITDDSGTHVRGGDLGFLHRILDFCPSAGVVITPSMYALLREAGYGPRLVRVEENLKGFGQRTFYESDGTFEIPSDQRQAVINREPEHEVLGEVRVPESDPNRQTEVKVAFNPWYGHFDVWLLRLAAVGIVVAALVVLQRFL